MNNRIKLLRRKLGISQQDFSDALNVKKGTIAKYENGKKELPDFIISLICNEFYVNEEWLRHGSGDMFVESPKKWKVLSAILSICEEKDENAMDMIISYSKLDAARKEAVQEFIRCISEK